MSKWGFKTATHTTGTAGTACGEVLAANASRRFLLLQNNASGTVSLGLGGSVAVGAGIRLNPQGSAGDAYAMTIGASNLYTGAIQAASNTGGTAKTTILITEGV